MWVECMDSLSSISLPEKQLRDAAAAEVAMLTGAQANDVEDEQSSGKRKLVTQDDKAKLK